MRRINTNAGGLAFRLSILLALAVGCAAAAAYPRTTGTKPSGVIRLKHLKIDQWDALIVGDGSGTGWKQGAGWAAVLIDHTSFARKLF